MALLTSLMLFFIYIKANTDRSNVKRTCKIIVAPCGGLRDYILRFLN